MTHDEIMHLINRSLFAEIGYTDKEGRQNIRKVFCVWHKGLGRHLISTNTGSGHVQSLLQNPDACLYFSDDASFEAVCLDALCRILSGNIRNCSGIPAMRSIIRRGSTIPITACWNSSRRAADITALTAKAICADRSWMHMMPAEPLKTDMPV